MKCRKCEDDLERMVNKALTTQKVEPESIDGCDISPIALYNKYAKIMTVWGTPYISPAQSIINRVEQSISDNKTLVILESPYAGDVDFNLNYARKCLKDSLTRGESPIASHLLHTQVLNDCDPTERALGIDAGLDWLKVAEKQVFYTDLGWSEGMRQARIEGERLGIEIEERKIFK